MSKKKEIEAISQAAITDADALSAVYQEVFTSRLTANLEAIGANTVGTVAQNHAKIAQQIATHVAQAYAKEAEDQALQVVDLPMPKVRLKAPQPESIDVESLLPNPEVKTQLRLA
ncbi:MAG: hypothetical protein Q6M54_05750 [Thermostichus sp. DRC_bins_24]